MKEEINNKIVDKVREVLLNHEENYSEGAWEKFLAKKEEKKRRIIYWHFRTIAASLLILIGVSIAYLKKTNTISNSETNKFVKQNPQLEDEKKLLEETKYQNHKLKNKPENQVTFYNPKHIFSDSVSNKIEKLNTGEVKNNEDEVTFNNIAKLSSNKEIKIKNEKSASRKSVIASSKNMQESNKREKLNKIEAELLSKSINKMDFNSQIVKVNIELEIINDNLKPIQNLEDYINNDTDSNIERIKEKVKIGFLVSPSYGSSSNNNQSNKFSSLGGGVELNIPIKKSKFSFNTGAIANTANFISDKNSELGLFSDVDEEKNKNEISYVNLDIPLNVTYNFKNFYIQTGVSSYIIIKEKSVLTSSYITETEVKDIVNGELETYVNRDVYSTTQTSENNQIGYTPFGSINFSIGYRARVSKGLIYEIQPFYKHSLKGLTTEIDKTSMAGVALKLFFSK